MVAFQCISETLQLIPMFLQMYTFSTAGKLSTTSVALLNHHLVITAKSSKTFDGNRNMTVDVNLLFCIYFFVVWFGFFSLERPKIYEKETDFDKIERVELRSKHKIQCTVSGNPDPKIEWKWQPCSLTDML